MYFYAIYGIIHYTDLLVFPVTDLFCLCEVYCYSFHYLMTTTSLLLSSLMSISMSIPFCTILSSQVFTILSTTSFITIIVTSSQMTTFQKEQRKIWEFYSRKSVENTIYYKKKHLCYDYKEKDSGY
jgi:hypothetical protein